MCALYATIYIIGNSEKIKTSKDKVHLYEN